ncbi:MAG: hypothetical protein K5918_00265 [Bacteroidales bacterium]|nr:hypothetical protein [Bacteroidales bacterium]
MNENEIVSEDILEAMGISRPAYEEVQTIIGRLPTVDELSTLLAMWQSQGERQGLLSWLKGQPHAAERHEYLENDLEPQSKEIKEPRVKECIAIARSMFGGKEPAANNIFTHTNGERQTSVHRGDALYMIGDVSEFFVDSEYGRKYLHLVSDPITMDNEQETADYLALILGSLKDNGTLFDFRRITSGGLFGTLLDITGPASLGFDILTCREVRLDAFLFGEQGVRFIATTNEPKEDFFLQKLTEARVNCCFLGRATKGRILVDGMDFGSVNRYGRQ